MRQEDDPVWVEIVQLLSDTNDKLAAMPWKTYPSIMEETIDKLIAQENHV